ncbi:MAG: ferredoxin [Alteraurantiacibacter sp.]
MYICVCNAIREKDLKVAARCTSGAAESVYAALGKRPNCGQCLDDAQLLIDEARACDLVGMIAA